MRQFCVWKSIARGCYYVALLNERGSVARPHTEQELCEWESIVRGYKYRVVLLRSVVSVGFTARLRTEWQLCVWDGMAIDIM